MAYEDDLIKAKIIHLEGAVELETITGIGADILNLLLSKINKLEQEVKELKYGGKKLK